MRISFSFKQRDEDLTFSLLFWSNICRAIYQNSKMVTILVLALYYSVAVVIKLQFPNWCSFCKSDNKKLLSHGLYSRTVDLQKITRNYFAQRERKSCHSPQQYLSGTVPFSEPCSIHCHLLYLSISIALYSNSE